MEAYLETGEAFLALVLSVQPDNSMTIESVGQNNDGEYRNETLTKKKWQLWRPVFIQAT